MSIKNNLDNNDLLIKLLTLAIGLALAVILLGAYTRLTNAGLGCPDWPGCYGQIIVPKTLGADNYGATWEFNSTKAWTEMVHRYLAGSLGLLIISICGLSIFNTIKNNRGNWALKSILLPVLLFAILVFQAALGMWTVTLKLLPTVVMGHLIGGLVTLSLLVLILLNTFKFTTNTLHQKSTKIFCFLTLIMVFIQIILGGWTSSNYAALPCLDFPSCNNQYLPQANTLSAMNPFMSIGPNYEGGILSNAMRVTIQLFHRWGAFVTSILVIISAIKIRKYNISYYNKFSFYLICLLLVQISLGIINVKWALPLVVAVLHNGIAAILLVSMIVLNYKINYSELIKARYYR